MKRIISLLMAAVLLGTFVSFGTVFAAEEKLTTDKTTYTQSEPIMVTAQGSGLDWVGIYFPGEEHSIRWTYVTDVGSGTAFNMRTAGEVNEGAPETLSPGDYIIRLMPDDTSDLSRAIKEIEITIVGDTDAPESGGDMSKLTVNKTAFGYNEAITVSAVGSGKDWVGIYYPDAEHSLYWTYVTEVGSGTEFNMRTVAHKNNSAPSKLSAGSYIIRLMPNDSENIADAIAWVGITIEAQSGGAAGGNANLKAPVSATYQLKNNTDGFSEGTLTVKLGADNSAEDIVCYWANDKGKLEGYTSLAKFKVTGETTVREMGKNTLIPAGATKLLVYGALNGKLSADCFEIKLPEGAASKDFGDPIVEFQVASDIHIKQNNNDTYNKNFVGMLQDIAKNSKNSIGLFVAGDMADSGNEKEYKNMVSLHASVKGAPDYYLAIGNHDLYNGSLEEKTALFLKYAKLPSGAHPESSHYDFWLEGYHFVFIGNDALVGGLKTTLNTDTLNWLNKTLAQDRDAGRPTFVFLHQSLYNTVAGSFPGQGWDGVVTDAKLRNLLKKYPEVVMFNGHSHWTLDSEGCMYVRDDKLPTIFNTASGAYLWTSYNVTGGENLNGSQGYYIRVYKDKVLVLGRDYKTGEWVSSAQFYVDYNGGLGCAEHLVRLENSGIGGEIASVTAPKGGTLKLPEAPKAEGYTFEGWYTDAELTAKFDENTFINEDITLYAKWAKGGSSDQTPDDNGADQIGGDSGSNLPLILGVSAGAVFLAVAAAVVIVILKKKKG